ncbi:MAG: helix-turn-helix domain-containing protein [Solirubrobacteraceae bacterium]
MDAQTIQQAYRFALDPTVEQERFLAGCAGASRFWFNQGLASVKERLDHRAAGQVVDVPWSYKGLCVAFRGEAIKDELAPRRAEVVTGSYQAGLEGSAGRCRTSARVARPAVRSGSLASVQRTLARGGHFSAPAHHRQPPRRTGPPARPAAVQGVAAQAHAAACRRPQRSGDALDRAAYERGLGHQLHRAAVGQVSPRAAS